LRDQRRLARGPSFSPQPKAQAFESVIAIGPEPNEFG
jgi:hypothetical protein